MAANLFGRYVWLMDILLRYKRLTYEEICELWQESGLSYGEELPLRTFHNHQKAIKDIFDVYIEYPLAELSQRILDSANGLVVFVVNVL